MEIEKTRVLLVEDNEGDVIYITRQLKKAPETKFEVTAVGWLNAALQMLEARDYDVILLDLSLPDCQDGIDTLMSVVRSARGAALPILVMTGHDDKETAKR